MNIYFLTLVPFPNGAAQTNRLISLTSGLVKIGCHIKVICLKPTENQEDSLNNRSKGKIGAVEFIYTSGTSFRSKSPIQRIYLYLTGIIFASHLLKNDSSQKKINFVFIGVCGFAVSLWFYILCKILNIKYIQERTEYPFIKAKKSIWDGLSLFLYLNITCKLFDGFIVITRKLHEYFKPYLRKDIPVFILPILVEPERFKFSSRKNEERYIAYCGNMQGNKDGISILIDAFIKTNKEFPDIKLYLIGDTAFQGFTILKEKIAGLNLSEKIVFTGIADRIILPELLFNAIMLVLARPANKQAEAGFPTKLGEYLATGKPVVVTRVGEIPDYLQDNINAYIAEPNSVMSFSLKMNQVITHYDEALRVGREGQRLAETVFCYIFQAKRLVAWLEKL